jgi:hypothetical protein
MSFEALLPMISVPGGAVLALVATVAAISLARRW